jgi:RNA-directed DNA polymerase
MSREVHVRFREGAGVRFPCATRLIIGCELKADAHRMMAVLPQRCARYGLPMHPTKTALMAVSKPETPQGSAEGNGTCDFLGLTHDWTRSRRGDWVSKRRTAQKRLRRTKKSLWRWGRQHRHTPLQYQYQQLCQTLRGHFQYDGIRGHFRLREAVRSAAEKAGDTG